MNDTITTALQIVSILASGGALQFITFLIKRADDVRKLGHHTPDTEQGGIDHPVKASQASLLFASESDLVGTVLAHEKEISVLKSKLKRCQRNLSTARKAS